MKKLFRKITNYILLLALMVTGLSGCAFSGTSEGTEASQETLSQYTSIPEDGIITASQLETIAGSQGTWYFTGSCGDYEYTWAYQGEEIKNPEDQKLDVDITEEGLEDIKALASNPDYALAVTLEDFNLAANPTLTIKLKDSWNASRILFCIYENQTLYQLSDASLDSQDPSLISLNITKTGNTFYVLAGGAEHENVSEASDNSENVADTEKLDEAENSDNNDSSSDAGSAGKSDSTDKNDSTGKAENSGKSDGTCTIGIRCDTILDNMDKLDSSKAEFVPEDGVILETTTVELQDGDSVFDILKRVCKKKKIQMSSQYTPLYGSYYVEGINQLYEFDCGENSGWIYSVNGWSPNYGASDYSVEAGDVILWEYTCDLGSDL